MSILNPKEPLWLPHGSVRAILALSLVWSLIYLACTDKPDTALVVAVTGLTGTVIGYYFAKRSQDTGTPSET